jgi:hypothetical protein
MQHVFQATAPHDLKPISAVDRWLDPVAALYPKFLFESVDETTVLEPARQRLVKLYGADAIVKLKSPAPECFILDALHVRPQAQGPLRQNCAVILCPGANGYYEDSFTFTFVQVLMQRCRSFFVVLITFIESYYFVRSGSNSTSAMCTS